MFVFLFCTFCFPFCVFCVFVLFCVFFSSCTNVSFIFVYKFTDHYHRVETQLQLINIISYVVFKCLLCSTTETTQLTGSHKYFRRGPHVGSPDLCRRCLQNFNSNLTASGYRKHLTVLQEDNYDLRLRTQFS